MNKPTPNQLAIIRQGWNALAFYCEDVSWQSTAALKEAVRLERRIVKDTWHARCLVMRQWIKGYSRPSVPAHEIYYIREGALKALLLGVQHADNTTLPDRRMAAVEDVEQAIRAWEAVTPPSARV